ncbi:probable cytochrome P450 49a1 isoform X1 [Thrips palmi]|uniref:Probable cytochrome P450 49a1 isoform X1 n=1 Tax=Thrips palmi TaxID=161013 RepID=A0A6P8Z1W7_THRPL|nr:probable cytochrome P450 49a1 isoform X1 [Thrips palmi]
MDRVCLGLHERYGDIVKVAGLMGRPDMVFVFDADLIEQVFRAEDALLPVRPSMPSLDAFKHGIRKDLFGDLAGVIAVHGPRWLEFRTRVQQVMLQPRTAKRYVGAIQDTAESFVTRIRKLRDSKGEVPADFVNEIHKWSLESIARVALDARLGCLDDAPPADTQALIDAVNTFFMNVGVLELKPPLWKIFPTPTWRAYIAALNDITTITSRYITRALEALQALGEDKKAELGNDASLLQRVLVGHDARTAHILAIDLFLVGIDTVRRRRSKWLPSLDVHLTLTPSFGADLRRAGLRAVPDRAAPRGAGDPPPGGGARPGPRRRRDGRRARGHAVPARRAQGGPQDVPRGDRQRPDPDRGHGGGGLPYPQRDADHLPALRGQQPGALLPRRGVVSAVALAPRGVPAVPRAPVRVAALRLRPPHVHRAPLRRAGAAHRRGQDGAELPARVQPPATAVPRPPHVHAARPAQAHVPRSLMPKSFSSHLLFLYHCK